jgi:DNA-binding MarR family transcriptional regulator
VLDLEMIRYYDSRDALPDQLSLGFDREHDKLTWDGASKNERKQEEQVRMALQQLIAYRTDQKKRPTTTTLRGFLHGTNDARTELIKSMKAQGLIEFETQERTGKSGRPKQFVNVTAEGQRVAGRV